MADCAQRKDMTIDLQALESRLRALEDWKAVYEHEIYYAHLLDTGQTKRVADDIFTADAELGITIWAAMPRSFAASASACA